MISVKLNFPCILENICKRNGNLSDERIALQLLMCYTLQNLSCMDKSIFAYIVHVEVIGI